MSKQKAIVIEEEDGRYTIMFINHPDWTMENIPSMKSVGMILKILDHKIMKTYKRKEL